MSGYTVSEVAKLSGVSVRTLHHYDEVGLLKPAAVGANGYRYYGKDELLRLQQILFHRELGFALEEIGRVLDAPDFDRVAALKAHRERLVADARRYRRLVRTIDETLAALEGETTMDEKGIYAGFDFDPEKQAAREARLVERFGDGARPAIERSLELLSKTSPADLQARKAEQDAIEAALVAALEGGAPADSAAVQSLMRRQHAWVGAWWGALPDKPRFVGLGRVYVEDPEFRARYDSVAPGLSEYLAEAMRVFAEREL
ncbi:MerR family transcriptional regulator [Phenylobacterium sp.]|uniref:MerR family transcriptional regulator n=1 Tax=Phenylobacterium sp. TaxID=1871053 RepID=UPI002DF51944|nr:MerR family transcriptional regulator [Phenylobacterium sp.]